MARRNPYARPDARTRAAKERGFPARSVFKLEEIDSRVGLLRPGLRVLDLGAAPGSWTLYASRRVGVGGRVVAVDLQELAELGAPNVIAIQGDALTLDLAAVAEHAPYDVVLSDMAPNTSGNKARDQARSEELFLRALAVAAAVGRPGSAFVGKLFMSAAFEHARAEVRQRYAAVRTIRPEGTRSVSSEVFLVGQGRLAPAAPLPGGPAGG
ncbi:MAG: RlmE family RNA methyltransferase [Polyangiaceae bacterium]|nr:RlmE family RNA methyltransferase [Polyangiaceae bacterium]